jgi:Cu/Ag efflux protein CusF
MFKPLAPVLICLLVATAAHAQSRGGGHGRGGGGGGHAPSSSRSTSPDPAKPAQPPKAPNKVEIVGVIQAIDREHDRVTIAYEAVEDLNWPAGAHPFPVEKTALLDGATVGEKIRFNVDSGQISALKPF